MPPRVAATLPPSESSSFSKLMMLRARTVTDNKHVVAGRVSKALQLTQLGSCRHEQQSAVPGYFCLGHHATALLGRQPCRTHGRCRTICT